MLLRFESPNGSPVYIDPQQVSAVLTNQHPDGPMRTAVYLASSDTPVYLRTSLRSVVARIRAAKNKLIEQESYARAAAERRVRDEERATRIQEPELQARLAHNA